ncbi:MAG: phosphatidylglycerophosphatase A [Bacteroidetes bacterium]|nr:phosphatidylglycerophosphatase A [Bacteroidota bacterium]
MEQPQNNIENQKSQISFLTKIIGSGFFTGYAPVASGTFGSLAGLAFFLIPSFSLPQILIPATIVLFYIGGRIAESMEKIYGQDPAEVTVDEIVGMWISLWFIPFSYLNYALAFIIFRILDILKPYPAAEFDKKSGGWNIMLDDVIAGMYTNIIIQIALRINLFN